MYKIDGTNVKQNNSERERQIADFLHNKFGGDVELVPEVKGIYNYVKTPDYIWRDGKWDLKELSSTKEEGIRNAIHKKKEQADNFIIDISKNKLDDEEIIKYSQKIFSYDNTKFVKNLMVVRDDKVIIILERK